jgi:hypothetical protein
MMTKVNEASNDAKKRKKFTATRVKNNLKKKTFTVAFNQQKSVKVRDNLETDVQGKNTWST